MNTLQPYLSLVGERPWLQALIIIIASLVVARLFNRFIITFLRQAAAKRTRIHIAVGVAYGSDIDPAL